MSRSMERTFWNNFLGLGTIQYLVTTLTDFQHKAPHLEGLTFLVFCFLVPWVILWVLHPGCRHLHMHLQPISLFNRFVSIHKSMMTTLICIGRKYQKKGMWVGGLGWGSWAFILLYTLYTIMYISHTATHVLMGGVRFDCSCCTR